MKGRKALVIGFGGITIFIVIATYLWYLYFLDFNNDGKFNDNGNQQGRLVMVDINGVNATNEESKADGINTPSYIFQINNRKTHNTNYILYIEDTPYNLVNDGCSPATTLKRSDLSYQLKLNNTIIKSGKLSDIKDNILDTQHINVNTSNQYELKVWISGDAVEWQSKHYHYKVTLREVDS